MAIAALFSLYRDMTNFLFLFFLWRAESVEYVVYFLEYF